MFGVVSSHNGAAATPGAGQTEYWDIADNQSNSSGTVEAGAASVTTSWTVNNDDWSVASVSIQADRQPPTIMARETMDADGDGQIDQIKITTDEALDDDFTGLTMTVAGYTVTGYSSDIANDNIFYVDLTESGTSDTDVTPAVAVTANTTLSDPSGNDIVVAVGVASTDKAVPVVLSVLMSDSALVVGETSTLTITFSEAVTNFDNSDITLANGTLTAVSSADGGVTWTGTFTPTDDIEDATNVISVGTSLTDLAGNAPLAGNSSANYAIDNTVPTVSITRDDTNPTHATSVTFSVDFSEDVMGVDATDFVLNVSGVTANATVTVGNAGDSDTSTYTVTVDTIAGDGTLGLDIAGANNIIDLVTNAVGTTPTTDEAYTIVNNAPNITSSSSPNVAENTTTVITVTASDTDGDTPSFSITGGADQAEFSINAISGDLTFNAAPNYESPTDSDANNVYLAATSHDITIKSTSADMSVSTQSLMINLTDVDEFMGPRPGSEPPPASDDDDAETEADEETETEEAISVQSKLAANIAPPVSAPRSDPQPSEQQAAVQIIVIPAAPEVESTGDAELLFSTTIGGYLPQSFTQTLQVVAEVAPQLVDYIDPQLFWERLDDFQDGLRGDDQALKLTTGTVAISSLALTAGYLFWMVNGGYLLAGMVSQMTAWQMVDPLPIFDAAAGGYGEDEEDDEIGL